MKIQQALLLFFLTASFAWGQTETATLSRSAIGVEVVTAETFIASKSTGGMKFKLPKKDAVVISRVYPNSPAFKAAIQPDDLVERIGDTKTRTVAEFLRRLQSLKQEKRLT